MPAKAIHAIHHGCGGDIEVGRESSRCLWCGKVGVIDGGVVKTPRGNIKLYEKDKVSEGTPGNTHSKCVDPTLIRGQQNQWDETYTLEDLYESEINRHGYDPSDFNLDYYDSRRQPGAKRRKQR
jgi:hypothetical protein